MKRKNTESGFEGKFCYIASKFEASCHPEAVRLYFSKCAEGRAEYGEERRVTCDNQARVEPGPVLHLPLGTRSHHRN